MTHVGLLFFLPVACERQRIKTYLESVTFYLVFFHYMWLFGFISYGLRKTYILGLKRLAAFNMEYLV